MRSTLFSYIFGISLFLLPYYSEACVCAFSGDFSIEKMNEYDYVALVKVGRLILPMDKKDDETIQRFFEAEITEIDRFKGDPISKLKVFGGHRSFTYQTSCDLGIDPGEEWIVFGNKLNDEIAINYCSFTQIYRNEDGLRQWQYGKGITELILLDSTFNSKSRNYLELDKDSIFYENGFLERAQQFKNGKVHGKVTYFYPDGKNFGFVSYKNGVQDGPYLWLNPNGTISLEGKKRMGKDFKKRTFYKLTSRGKSPSMISFYDKKGNLNKFLDFGFGINDQKSYLRERTKFYSKKNRIVTVYYNENGDKEEEYVTDFAGNQIDLIQFDEIGKPMD